jgi:hypothetical protein
MCEAVSANAKEEFAWELSPRWHPVDFRVRCHLSTMLRPVYASARCCLLPAVRRTRPRITLALRCSQVHTPAPPTPTAINQADALPLSDAQRKTIYALSTPPGKSGIAVIRISGPDALCVWQRMVRPVRTRARTHDEERMPPPSRTTKARALLRRGPANRRTPRRRTRRLLPRCVPFLRTFPPPPLTPGPPRTHAPQPPAPSRQKTS